MRAIQIQSCGSTDVLQEAEIPKPKCGRNEVLVKVKAVGFNPVDYKMRKGVFPAELPKILGLDFSGVIEAKGDLVRDFSIGEEVFGLSLKGSYTEYISLPYQFIAKKPKNFTFEEAAAIPVAYLTAFQSLIAKGAYQTNRPLFIAGGSGGVGSAAISLAKTYNLGPVFTLAGSESSRNYLKKHFSLSDHQIIDYQGLGTEEIAKKLIEHNEGKQFYFSLDFVGKTAKEVCFLVADFYGHIATVLPEEETFQIPIWGRNDGPFWMKSLSLHMILILASAFSSNPEDWMIYRAQLAHLAGLFEKEELQKPVIENLGEFSVETVRKAHNQLETGHTKGKLVMTV